MAHSGRLTALAVGITVIAGVTAVWGAGSCEEGRGQTGVALASGDGTLRVSAVDGDSAGAAAGLVPGDVLLQVNGTVLSNCAEYARTVRDARKERKALLLLVRRASAEVPLALASSTWARAVAVTPPPPPAEPPSVRAVVAKPPPAPLPPETHVSVEEVTHRLAALVPPTGEPPKLVRYQRDLGHVQQEVATLVARGSAPADVLTGLGTVVRYYDAAGVAYAAAEAQLERERRPRHIPPSEGATAPYFESSEEAAVIDEFPFLTQTVVREPGPGLVAGESSGVWRPIQARGLLWERGREELGRLSSWLTAGAR